MAKSKSKSEVEYLRGENKKLKAQNRHLKKSLSRSDKHVRRFEELVDEQADASFEEAARPAEIDIPLKEHCPRCKAELEFVGIGNRRLVLCTGCDYRTSRKDG